MSISLDPPPCRQKREDMVDDENNAVVPHKCIVGILNLVRKEKQSDSLSLGFVGKHSLFVGDRHGIFSSPNRGVDQVLYDMSRFPPQEGNREATKGINTNMSRQNISTSLVLQNGVHMLDGSKKLAGGHFDRNQNEN